MRLKKLEIYGFKSFAERVELTFDQGITGIVGPNGSGKSNISDAVRWVLGEQSAKTLRGARMEDIIFNGTEKRKKLAYCEVTLSFDNEDKALPIEFAEVAVTRRVYRNGDSEYLINRSACRLKDIVDLFRDTGIGKEGYSLIGQGRIDEILSVKSEDRRQVFEEAAGIVKYKARKNEAERRMENTRQNLSRVEDLLTELEGRLEPLKQQSESAREYLALRDELKQLDLNAFLVRSERYEARIRELKETVASLGQSLEQATAQQQALTQRREQLEAAQAQEEQAAAAQREEVQRLIREVEAREGVTAVLRERIQSTRREAGRLAQELQEARQGGGGVDRQLQLHEERLNFEQAGVAQMRVELEERQRSVDALTARVEREEAQLEAAKQRVIDAMNRLSDVRSEQSRLTAMEGALGRQLEALEAERLQDEGAGEQIELRLEEAEEHLALEKLEQQALSEQAAQVGRQVTEAAQEQERLQAERAKTLAQRQETASRLKVLEEMQRDYEGYQHSVKQVLMQARRTEASGVHGVVANLIRVPRELERAIDMVLGGALQNVVVDREENAKRMIDYLRAGRLGRATFLPISAVRGRTLSPQERQVLSMPGCVGLASELIEFDPQYQGIVDSLLGRTVVARDLDAGIAIQRAGRHAFRLVTLEGDVMHSGGSMTGGSVQSRVTSLLSREREVSEHRERLQRLNTRLEDSQQAIERQEALRGQLKRQRGELYDRLHQQEIACAREEAHLAAAQAELAAHRQRGQRAEAERTRMQAQLSDVREELGKLDSAQGDVEQTSAGQQAEIVAQQRTLASGRAQLDGERQQLGDARVALAARERGLEALKREWERLTGQKGQLAEQIEVNGRQLSERQAALGEDQAQLSEDEQALAAFKAELAGARAAFDRVEGRRVRAQEELRELSRQLDVLRSDIDSFTDKHHRGDLTLQRVEAEFAQLQARIWEDYELTYAGAQSSRVEGFQLGEAEKRIAQLRSRIRAIGAVNVGAMDEYRQTLTRFEEMSRQREDLERAQLDLTGIVDELLKKMEVQFKEQFHLLNQNFQQTFVKLFGGGHAELRLGDPKDALNCGIEIVAQPPGKKLQMLSLLSGGERALTAIAILFAMLKLKPTPFCFLDEIEAALDDANIGNFADYLAEYSAKTQFVVVTHRKGTMERCDALYGIAMEEKGVSKLVSVKLSEGGVDRNAG